jgi:CubicO group peptidase (beta-lactamase class C family)
MRKLVSLLIVSVAFSCNTQRINNIKSKTAEIADSANIPVIQVAFKNQKEFISFELSQSDTLIASADENTVFQAASLSKPIFSYIVFLLADRGVIDLDVPLAEYTSIQRFENREWASKITARTVLSHQTGLPNWATSPSSEEWPSSVVKFKFKPDSAFSYSGEGYYLLQRAVEEISGKSLEQLAIEEVFTPFEMQHTSYEWKEEYDTLAADGFNREGESKGKGRHPRANSAYTLRTTARDYSKFLDVLMEGKGLKRETHHQMLTPVTEAVRFAGKPRECDSAIFWALGVGIEKDTEFGNIIFHWGDNGNFKALFIIIPTKKSHLVYFTNSARGHDIIDQVVNLYFSPKSPFKIGPWVNQPEPN